MTEFTATIAKGGQVVGTCSGVVAGRNALLKFFSRAIAAGVEGDLINITQRPADNVGGEYLLVKHDIDLDGRI